MKKELCASNPDTPSQLTKLSEKQSDLLVPVDDTNELISRLQSLADRLAGQTEIPGTTSTRERTTMTMTFGGVTTPPITMDDMENVSRHIGRTAKGTAKDRRHPGAESTTQAN